jgi:Xaa-Pro dipeptidase
MTQPVRLSSDFYRGRTAALQELLESARLDGILVLNYANVIYLSGFYHIPSERPIGVYVPLHGQPILFAPLLEQENSDESWIEDRRFYFEYPGEEHPIAWMLHQINAPSRRVGIDDVPFGVLAQVSANFVITRCTVVDQMRWTKTPEELELVEQAAMYADYCLEYLLAHAANMIRAGATELDLLRECLGATHKRMDAEVGTMFRLGGGGVVGTIHSGPRAALPHGAPGTRQPRAGDTLIAGIGAAVGGYHAESGATFIVGAPTADQMRCLRAAAACNDAAIQALRVGNSCEAVNAAALDVLHDAGLGGFIRHRIGHGMGIQAHEAPWLAPGDATPLAAGMVFSNEPGIYRPGVDGYRTINTMIVTDGEARVPSRFLANHPPEARVIPI